MPRRFLVHSAWLLAFLLLAATLFATWRWTQSHLLFKQEIWRSASAQQQPLDLLFIGSSRTRKGFSKSMLAGTGCTAGFLAYNGLSPALQEIVLEAVLTESPGARRIFVEAFSLMLYRRPALQDTRLFLDLPPNAKTRLVRFLQQSRQGRGWRDWLYFGLRSDNELIYTAPVYRRVREYTARVRPGIKDNQKQKPNRQHTARLPRDIDPVKTADFNASQLAALESMIKVAKTKGTEIIFIDLPYHNAVYHDPVTKKARVSIRNLLRAAELPYHDFQQTLAADNATLFQDSTHLSAAGSRIYTRKFIDTLSISCDGAPDDQ